MQWRHNCFRPLYSPRMVVIYNILNITLLNSIGVWNDVRLTEHRLQIWASDIKVHNQWLHFNSWSKFHHKLIVSYYTESRACTKESDETEHSIHGVEASRKLKARPTACAVLHLTLLAWENVTTNVTRGGNVTKDRLGPCQRIMWYNGT